MPETKTAQLKTFTTDTPVEQVIAEIRDNGAVIIEGLLSEGQLKQINSDASPYIDAADPAMKHMNPALDAFFGDKVRHVTGFAGKSATFANEVMCHPIFMAICDEFLLPGCADYQLNLGHVMDRGQGAEEQFIHRDEDVWVHCPRLEGELQLASIVAMVDFTRENGATVVVPGSHKWERDREPTPEEKAYAEMPAGSAVIYLGSALHAGGTNTTSEWRRGLHISYTHGWLRTEENNVLAVRPEVAATLSTRAQQLLGYGVHDAIEDAGGYLGMVDMRNPIELLEEKAL